MSVFNILFYKNTLKFLLKKHGIFHAPLFPLFPLFMVSNWIKLRKIIWVQPVILHV